MINVTVTKFRGISGPNAAAGSPAIVARTHNRAFGPSGFSLDTPGKPSRIRNVGSLQAFKGCSAKPGPTYPQNLQALARRIQNKEGGQSSGQNREHGSQDRTQSKHAQAALSLTCRSPQLSDNVHYVILDPWKSLPSCRGPSVKNVQATHSAVCSKLTNSALQKP